MGSPIVAPTKVEIDYRQNEVFWWSHYGLRPAYQADMRLTAKNIGNPLEMIVLTKRFFQDTREDGGEREVMAQDSLSSDIPSLLRLENLYFSRVSVSSDACTIFEGVVAYHPTESGLNCTLVEEVVRTYFRQYHHSFVELSTKDQPNFEELKRRYEEWNAAPVKMNLSATPHFLEALFGEVKVGRFQNIDHGFMKDGEWFVKLKDGSEHRIGKPHLTLLK